MDVTFLGTSGAIPTTNRNLSGIYVGGSAGNLLLDVGEGTLRQMLRFSTGLEVAAVCITHLHADHVLGLPGLLHAMEFYDRAKPLDIYTPTGTRSDIERLIDAPGPDLSFGTTVTELESGKRPIETAHNVIETFETEHRTRSIGYRIEESSVSNGDRTIVYTGDTRPTETTVEVAAGADLLVHDSMFIEDERDRARRTGHSTSAEAADVAARAGVERLALTHISSRHAGNVSRLEAEAAKVFGEDACVPDDGRTVTLRH